VTARPVGWSLNPARHLGQSRLPGCCEPTLTGNDPVALRDFIVTNGNWLKDAETAEGTRALFQVSRIDPLSRLVWIGFNAVDFDEECSHQPATASDRFCIRTRWRIKLQRCRCLELRTAAI
jgi:hypothetical protein